MKLSLLQKVLPPYWKKSSYKYDINLINLRICQHMIIAKGINKELYVYINMASSLFLRKAKSLTSGRSPYTLIYEM